MPHRGYLAHSNRKTFLGCRHQLVVFFLNVGSGHMTLVVMPGGMTFLIDCNVRVDDEDRVLGYMERHIPKSLSGKRNIDIFICTHRDADHIRGIDLVDDRFPIQQVWDTDVIGQGTDGEEYRIYENVRNRVRERHIFRSHAVLRLDHNQSYTDLHGATIECLSPPPPPREVEPEENEKRAHLYCGVLRIIYKNRTIIIPGDAGWQTWRDFIVPRYGRSLNCDVLLAGHHGSKTFFTDTLADEIDETKNPDTTYTKHLDLLAPHTVVISCEENDHHPNADALARYRTKAMSTNGASQVHLTDHWHHIVTNINADGTIATTPHWFTDHQSSDRCKVNLKAEVLDHGNWRNIKKEERLPLKSHLRFTAFPTFPECRPHADDITLDFAVSNAGEAEHDTCHEIYHCGQGDNARDRWNIRHRELVYKGRHLMICKAKSKTNSTHTAREVFPVIGT